MEPSPENPDDGSIVFCIGKYDSDVVVPWVVVKLLYIFRYHFGRYLVAVGRIDGCTGIILQCILHL